MKLINKEDPIYIQYENYIRTLKDEKGRSLLIDTEITYAILQYMKYIIKENKLDIYEILEGNIDELFNILEEDLKYFLSSKHKLDVIRDNKIYECLKFMYLEPLNCLALDDRILNNYIDSKKKYLLITTSSRPTYIPFENVDIYFYSKALHTKWKPTLLLTTYIYDKINNIKRNYINDLSNIHNEYDEIIFLNESVEFEDAYEYIKQRGGSGLINIFGIYKYKHISKYKDVKLRLFCDVDSMYIDLTNAYVKYVRLPYGNLDNTEERITPEKKMIWIKDLTTISDDKVKELLDSNKEIKDISIKVSYKEIKEHNYRIGISAYNNGKDELIDLVDQNERLIKRIHNLDEIISTKIDELVVR